MRYLKCQNTGIYKAGNCSLEMNIIATKLLDSVVQYSMLSMIYEQSFNLPSQ